MKKILITLLFLLSNCAFSDAIKVVSAESSITIDPKTIDSCSLTAIEKYTRHFIYNLTKSSYYLITQNFETGTGCFEGNNPQKLTVMANILDPVTGKINANPVWKFQTQSVSGGAESNFHNLYKTESPGCCSSVSTFKYFSLKTGKLVSSTTTDLRSITNTKNNTKVYIGVEANTASLPEKKSNAIATVILGTENGKFQGVNIESKKYSEEEWDVMSFNFILNKEAQKFYNNPSDYVVNSENNFKDVSMQLILQCRCEHEPLNIVLKMGENSLDVSASIVNNGDISLK